MNYVDLEKVNGAIKATPIKGKDYAEVNQRIKGFRMLYPNGIIRTTLLSDENGICKFKAEVMDEDGNLLGTGHAYEKESSSFINKTSYIENCETSAVGRALGMLGIGIDVSVASYEEVANAIQNQNDDEPKKKQEQKPKQKPEQAADHHNGNELLDKAIRKGVDINKICEAYKVKSVKEMDQGMIDGAFALLDKYADK